MAGKVLKGCFGLAALGGLIIIVIIATVLWRVKGPILDIRALQKTHEQLVALYDEVDDYTPPPSGIIPAPRMERFLTVRESLAEPRRRIEGEFAQFPPQALRDCEVEGLPAVKEVFKGLGRLIGPTLRYGRARNEALVAEEMGLGEYFYIYSIAYFSWLDHSPGDGPTYTDDGRTERLLDGEDSSFGVDALQERFHRYMERILGNQLSAELEVADPDSERIMWRETLRAEYLRFKDEPRSIPWEGNLPDPMREALAPYRERLARSYSEALNCIELAPMKESEWQWENE